MNTACYKITGRIKCISPVHIGSGQRTGVLKHSSRYIPGSFLRGATGIAALKIAGKESEFFSELFSNEDLGSSEIFFKNAYPIHLGCEGRFIPSRLTVSMCRNRQCKKIFDSFDVISECDVCGNSVKPFSGTCCDKCGKFDDKVIQTSRIASTAVDREKYSATAGSLHLIETIPKGTMLSFDVIVSRNLDNHLEQICSLMERALPDEGIGGSKSRGLGQIDCSVKMQEIESDQIVAKGIENTFQIQCVSPMILDKLQESSVLEAARRAYSWIFQKGKPSLTEISLKNQRIKYEQFSGWSLKTNQRRAIIPALSPGSVYEFDIQEKDKELSLALAALEYSAIGDYKPHGCGQVLIL